MQRSRPALLTLVTLFPILANPHPPTPSTLQSGRSQTTLNHP